ncbi:hypothetical protein JM84_1739 [Dokdonia sp. Hel_I_63]|uniref:hypothetical protein n=1 Tax=unclassified Dokdonia TaxID=2615033 RepID=UPI00020A7747|nr:MULTISPECIES: hypothetical protein [unclassified Dokdonia]AEE20926.1 hypothetical protein Krodi_2952 [Dokdonia sp. 4H-3-7-5]TVZ22827.1 hypothetical protein JM84_1739 [Dokdonia sp. Hel_I_63]
MESHNIEKLLDGYFEGATTLKEEQELRTYFTSDHVAPHLEKYASMFTAFSVASKETYDAQIVLPHKQRSKSIYRFAASAAAAVIVGLVLWTQNTQVDASISTNYENEELAILKTKQALGMMSQMINQSTTQLEVVQEFDKASSTLFK